MLDHGARLNSFQFDGRPLVAGVRNVDDALGARTFFGVVVAPVANRLAGPAVSFGDETVRLQGTDENGVLLHSGANGAHARIWTVSETGSDRVSFELDFGDGELGLPGNRRFATTYRIAPDALSLEIVARTDRATLCNPTHHPYWCLGAEARDLRLRVDAERYLPVDRHGIPTGRMEEVSGTVFDLRSPTVPHEGIDNTYCPGGQGLREVAWLSAPDGLMLTLSTDAPGLQVYTGKPEGIALEPQGWPDAPNHPHFPSILQRPGAIFRRRIHYRISNH